MGNWKIKNFSPQLDGKIVTIEEQLGNMTRVICEQGDEAWLHRKHLEKVIDPDEPGRGGANKIVD